MSSRRAARGRRPGLAAYVTGHGYGHAVRVAAVLRRLRALAPDLPIRIRGDVPGWIFAKAGLAGVLPADLDVGLAQVDGLEIDLGATLERLEAYEAEFPRRRDEEARWLEAEGIGLVVGDVPPLAFAAAAAAGVASVAQANFSWDWIYGHYARRSPAFGRHARLAAERAAAAEACLRLPFHGDLGAFRRRIDVPLVATRCELGRAEARAALGLAGERPLVLLSFGGHGLRSFPHGRLAAIAGVEFVATDAVAAPPPNLRLLDRRTLDYDRLLGAVDAVVTKPGYGIVAGALAGGVRVLYTSRGDFPEYPILVQALEAHGTAAFVPPETVRRGEIGRALRDLLERPAAPAALPVDGADRVARLLLGRLEGRPFS